MAECHHPRRIYMQQLPCYHTGLFLRAMSLPPQRLRLFTIWHRLIIKPLSLASLFRLPLAPTQMCGCLRITCKHLYCGACYKRAQLCLNTHSVAASLEEHFNCLLTRWANYMTATFRPKCAEAKLKMRPSSTWASQEGYMLHYCWCQTGCCSEYFTDIQHIQI